jgi:transposase-like protein
MNEAIRKAAEQGSGAVVCPRCKARIERASASVKQMVERFGCVDCRINDDETDMGILMPA